MANSKIASRWRELSGENDWDGLLHPLDLDLRRYIIHYGERAASVGDLFNNDKNTEGFGHFLYPKDEFFSGACLEKGNEFKYSVTHFFCAGSATVESSCFGLVAVTTDEGKAVLGRRDILIAWRGTITFSEWINNVNVLLKSASELFGTDDEPMVHGGFLSLYTGTRSDSAYSKTSARNQVRDALRELVNKYQDEDISITVTGFSLGAALATLNAMDIVANGYNKPTNNAEKSCMVTAFVYGGPRVGNDGLEKVFNRLCAHDLRLLRIQNAKDPVPKVPIGYYTHLGKKLPINSNESGYLKWKPIFGRSNNIRLQEDSNNISEEERTSRGLIFNVADYVSAHNMDVYLHAIAGVQEAGFEFCLEVDHDIALVNKHLDRLKDKFKVPTHWWDGENRKKMVQVDSGHWLVMKHFNT